MRLLGTPSKLSFDTLSSLQVFGGTPVSKDLRLLAPSSRLDVLVATPGRLIDHLEQGRFGNRLKGLRVLVIES